MATGIGFTKTSEYATYNADQYGTGSAARPNWGIRIASLPNIIKAGPGTNDFVLWIEFEGQPREQPNNTDGYIFGLGEGSGTPFIWLKQNGSSQETQLWVGDGTNNGINSEWSTHGGARHQAFFYVKPTAGTKGQAWCFSNGQTAHADNAADEPNSTGYPLGVGTVTAGLFFHTAREAGSEGFIGSVYKCGLWYLPSANYLTEAQIKQAAWELYLNDSTTLLPFTLAAGCMVHIPEISETDLTNGTITNQITHSTGSNTFTKTGVATLAHREGLKFSAAECQDTNRAFFVRVTNSANETSGHLDVADGASWGCIWESYHKNTVRPQDTSPATTAQTLIGDGNNRLEFHWDGVQYVIRANVDTAGTPVTATSPTAAAFQARRDAWAVAALINNGDATNNIFAAYNGRKGTSVSKATSAASGNFCFFQHTNDSAAAVPEAFSGQIAFVRIIKIKTSYFPDADLDEILRFHAESFDPYKSPGALHPKLIELLAKTDNGSPVIRIATYAPDAINYSDTDITSAPTWTCSTQNTVAAASVFTGTMVTVNTTTLPVRRSVAVRTGWSRRVIHLGDPAGSAPSTTLGVPVIGAGTAAGPYAGASLYSTLDTLVSVKQDGLNGANIASVNPGEVYRHGVYDYSTLTAPALDTFFDGFPFKKTIWEAPVVSTVSASARLPITTVTGADIECVGGMYTSSATDGFVFGATAIRCALRRAVCRLAASDGLFITSGATYIDILNNLLIGNTALGLNCAANDTTILIMNNITQGNGSADTLGGTSPVSNFNCYQAALTAGTAGAYDIIAAPIFKDIVTAINYAPVITSVSVHTGRKITGVTAGWTQGPFEFSDKPAYVIDIGGGLVVLAGGGVSPKV